MHHNLKILPKYFDSVAKGRKTFEIRKDDRGFKRGHTVTLQEYDPEHKSYSGREYNATIGYVTAYEQQQGYVVFSLLGYNFEQNIK